MFQSLERLSTEPNLEGKAQADSAGPGSPRQTMGAEHSYLVSRGTDGFVSGASVFQWHCPS